MTLNTGARAQFGFERETTPGTYIAPTEFWEFVSEDLQYTRPPVPSRGIGGGRRTERSSVRTNFDVAGTTSHELVPDTAVNLLRAMFGASTGETGSGPYTNTFTAGNDLEKYTLQVGRPGTGGTVHPWSYTGCMVASGSIQVRSGDLIGLNLNWVGQNETLAESLETASFANPTRWSSVQASLTLGGTAYCFDTFDWNFDNGLEVHHPVCATNPGQASIREANLRSYGGQLVADFDDLTVYNYFKNNTKNALVLTISDGTYSLTITQNVRYDEVGVTVPGVEVLKNSIGFMGEGTTDASVMTAVFVGPDSSA